MDKWEYKGFYNLYDMSGEISIGTGIVQVHDIFNPLPSFMKKANILFCDPPCSEGNMKSFYTKASLQKNYDYSKFEERIFEVIKEISPQELFLEVFASNKEKMIERVKSLYQDILIYDSTYYHSKKYRCWILHAGTKMRDMYSLLNGKDEQDCIEIICKTLSDNDVIADPCMGQGLVGYYANKYGKKFVGTELNKKRLAVLLERINKNSLKV